MTTTKFNAQVWMDSLLIDTFGSNANSFYDHRVMLYSKLPYLEPSQELIDIYFKMGIRYGEFCDIAYLLTEGKTLTQACDNIAEGWINSFDGDPSGEYIQFVQAIPEQCVYYRYFEHPRQEFKCDCCGQLTNIEDSREVTDTIDVCKPCILLIDANPELVYVEIPYWNDNIEEEQYTYELARKKRDYYEHPYESEGFLATDNGNVTTWRYNDAHVACVRKLTEFNTLEELETHVKSLQL